MPRILVCGCNGVDKSGFVEDFLVQYPMYKKGGESYKNLLQKDNVYGSQELQLKILNSMIDDVLNLNKTDNIIISHGILDNLVDSMWLNVHLYPEKISNVDDNFVRKSVALVRNTLHFLDLVIWLPKTVECPIIYDNPNDEVYDEEIDNFFAAIEESYTKYQETIFEFSSPDGAPGLIQVYGSREERLAMVKLYLDTETGDFLGKVDKDSLIQMPPDLESQVLFDTISKQVSGK